MKGCDRGYTCSGAIGFLPMDPHSEEWKTSVSECCQQQKHCRSFRWDGFMWQTESQTNPDNLLEMKSRKSPQNLVLSAGGRSLGSDFISVVLALLSEAAPPSVLQCWPVCSCRISQLLAGAPVYLSMCLQPCLCITCSGRLHSILPAREVLGWTRCIPWLVP